MKTQLLLIITLLLTTTLQAQDVLLYESFADETLVYNRHNANGTSASIVRNMLQAIAPHGQAGGSFDLNYSYQLRVVDQGTQLKGSIDFTEITVTGEPQPMGFPFADLLYPRVASFGIDLLANDEPVLIQCVEVDLDHSGRPRFVFTYDQPQPGTVYTIRIVDLDFVFLAPQLQAVRQRKAAIQEYRAAAAAYQALTLDLDQLTKGQPDPDYLSNLRQQLDQLSVQVGNLDGARFWNVLPLEGPAGHDPQQVVFLRDQTNEQLVLTQQWHDDLLANIHELYYQKGLSLYDDRQYGAARQAFQRSLRTADCYPPSHYLIAVLDFNDGRIDPAAQRIRKVINNYGPDPQTEEGARELARQIVRFYLDEGSAAVAAAHYPEGVAFYQKAQAFSGSIHHFTFGQVEAESRIREAFHLDFHHQLDNVQQLARQGQYEQALADLEVAMAFQQEFRVPSNFDTDRLQRKLVQSAFDRQLTQLRQWSQDQRWDEGIQSLPKAESFLQRYPGIVQNERELLTVKGQLFQGKFNSLYRQGEQDLSAGRLAAALQASEAAQRFATQNQLSASTQAQARRLVERVQEARYAAFIAEGDQLVVATEFQQALNKYKQAKALEPKLAVQPVDRLSGKMQSTARAAVLQAQQRALQLHRQDNQEIAATLRYMKGLSDEYLLVNDAEVTAAIAELEDQRCTNANEIIYPEAVRRFHQHEVGKDYIAAQSVLDELRGLLAEYPSCGLDGTVIRVNNDVVVACANFQETLLAAQQAEDRRQYKTAIEQYQAAKGFYENRLVAQRLPAHPAFELYSYVFAHEDASMLLQGANYYGAQQDFESAMNLLREVIDRGVNPKNTDFVQTQLGDRLAIANYAPDTRWKRAISPYVSKGERRKMRFLYQAFRKRWKRMS